MKLLVKIVFINYLLNNWLIVSVRVFWEMVISIYCFPVTSNIAANHEYDSPEREGNDLIGQYFSFSHCCENIGKCNMGN